MKFDFKEFLKFKYFIEDKYITLYILEDNYEK